MKRTIPWLSSVVLLLPACGSAQSSSEQPEAEPAVVATVEVKTPTPDETAADKRAQDRAIAESAGVLGALADAGAFTSVFGSGLDEPDGGALGGIWGNTTGESYGAGGLGLSGIGRGGGGSGEGTIGLGGIGTIGKGGGGSGAGYGTGHGRLGSRRTAPRLVQGNANVQGALDKEIIRRVIRRHVNQFRYCYQRRLVGNPNLEGKVATRFTISPSGDVTTVQDAGSTMPDRDVTTCVQRVFKRMRFPEPKGGWRGDRQLPAHLRSCSGKLGCGGRPMLRPTHLMAAEVR